MLDLVTVDYLIRLRLSGQLNSSNILELGPQDI